MRGNLCDGDTWRVACQHSKLSYRHSKLPLQHPAALSSSSNFTTWEINRKETQFRCRVQGLALSNGLFAKLHQIRRISRLESVCRLKSITNLRFRRLIFIYERRLCCFRCRNVFFLPSTHRSQTSSRHKGGESFCCCALSRVARNTERQLYHDVLNNSARIMLLLRIPAFLLCLPRLLFVFIKS